MPRSLSRPMILALPTLVRSRKEQRKRRERTGRILWEVAAVLERYQGLKGRRGKTRQTLCLS